MYGDYDCTLRNRWKGKRTILSDCAKKNPMLK